MKIELDNLRFSCPPGMTDRSSYTFSAPAKGESPPEMLMVEYAPVDPPGANAAQVLAERKDQVLSVVSSGTKFGSMDQVSIGGIPGRIQALEFRDGTAIVQERWAACLRDSNTLFLAYTVPSGTNPDPDAEFRRIIETVTFANSVTGEIPADYVTRTAAIVSLAIPTRLEPPRVYLFEEARTDTRIMITIHSEPASFDQHIAEDRQEGQIEAREERPVVIKAGSGKIIGYTLIESRAAGRSESAIRRANLKLQDQTFIEVSGRAPVTSAATLDRGISALLDSIESS